MIQPNRLWCVPPRVEGTAPSVPWSVYRGSDSALPSTKVLTGYAMTALITLP